MRYCSGGSVAFFYGRSRGLFTSSSLTALSNPLERCIKIILQAIHSIAKIRDEGEIVVKFSRHLLNRVVRGETLGFERLRLFIGCSSPPSRRPLRLRLAQD